MSENSRHPTDRIVLEGMQFYGFHGVNAEEKSLGQPYVVDLAVEMDLSIPGKSDRLEDTVSYTHLYRSVRKVIEGESRNLLEAAAENVAIRILDEFPVKAVQVRVKKPRPPIKGSLVENAVVEIYRVRE
ncbi:MAG: dihydroneopterin aldolase [Chloroflexi bacterium]|nr:dihydroneopterin aldolase [Chloroflexota bacterium]|tara:strand:+ start:124 stop:510 length:387 start_codon:yes stop_codon:yes gene_type:complete